MLGNTFSCRLTWTFGLGCPLVFGFAGCAQGESEVAVLVTPGDGAAGDGAASQVQEGGAADDVTGTSSDASGDATSTNDAADTNDGADTSDADATPDAPGDPGDAAPPVDAVAEASVPPDATTPDAQSAQDASLDAPADVVDAASPTDASCTTTCGAQALCIGGDCVASRRVFVSSERFTGNLGGTSGADHSCQSLADAARIGGTWKAWVSDSTTSPSTRFTQAAAGYRLLDGTLLASGWTGLVSGSLLHGIDLTEQRTTADNSDVWTGTLSSGVAIGSNVCSGFTSSANGATQAVIGNTSRTDIGWSNATSQSCDHNDLRIYCMEQ